MDRKFFDKAGWEKIHGKIYKKQVDSDEDEEPEAWQM